MAQTPQWRKKRKSCVNESSVADHEVARSQDLSFLDIQIDQDHGVKVGSATDLFL